MDKNFIETHEESDNKQICFPVIIEKCPICGKIYKSQSDYCELCGKQLSNENMVRSNEIRKSQSFNILIQFFKSTSKLFTILATIGALIILSPLFSNFVLGENWLNSVLSSPLGFQSLILIIISSFGIVFFVYYILWLIFLDFLNEIWNNITLSSSTRIQSAIFIAIGLFAIFCLFLFLIFIWFTKLDFLISIIGFYLFIFLIGVPVAIMMIGFLWENLKKMNERLVKIFCICVICVLFIVIIITSIQVCQGVLAISNEMSKYYSNKTIPVNIKYDIVNRPDNTPIILSLKGNIDAYFSKEISDFDKIYAQCRWSTNYGNFISITSNNSVIKKQSQELIIPGCGDPRDKIYWTYDIEDYGKSKPLVLIGLNLEDPNKKVNNQLGDAHLIINWTDTDTIKFDNESFLIFK